MEYFKKFLTQVNLRAESKTEILYLKKISKSDFIFMNFGTFSHINASRKYNPKRIKKLFMGIIFNIWGLITI